MVLTDYIKTNKDAFIAKVQNISDALGIIPDWLMVVMYMESGLNEKAVNYQKGDSADPYTRSANRATGLIQFMPSTAAGLGVTTQQLYQMSNVDQLDYVYEYFSGYAGDLHSVYDLYLVTFFPAALGESDDWVIHSNSLSAATIARYNTGIDLNKDSQITVGEFKQYIDNLLKKKELADLIETTVSTGLTLTGAVLIGLAAYYMYKYYQNE